jgi:hypothetical protein
VSCEKFMEEAGEGLCALALLCGAVVFGPVLIIGWLANRAVCALLRLDP